MTGQARAIEVDALIDQTKLNRYQILIIAMCAVIVMLDGFDTQSIGFLAASISDGLQIPLQDFGTVFSAGLFGLMIGALTMGPISDRFGRRWTVIASTVIFGLFTLLTAEANTLTELIAYRFLTGLGLGGAIPNLLALATEFAPRRLEGKIIGWLLAGIPTGALIGGVLTNLVLPHGGWRGVLYIGGALPLLMAIFLVLKLPESVRFLIASGADQGRVRAVMRRIAPASAIGPANRFFSSYAAPKGIPVRHLFTEGRTPTTLLFWVVYFSNLLIIYFVVSWFPALLRQAGMEISAGITAATLFSAGGALGCIVQGRVMELVGARLTVLCELTAAMALIGILANSAGAYWPVMVAVTLLGVVVQGAQAGINGIVAGFYPTTIRSTALGWGLGIGRVGSIIGPLLGGVMLAMEWPLSSVFMAGMIPAALAAAAIAASFRAARPKVLQAAE